MASPKGNPRKKPDPPRQARRGRPASTPEERENQLISLADKLAEKQMRDGTASAQVITHYLKLGSSRERLEQQRLNSEVDLLRARVEQAASAKRVEELYEEALNSMRIYSGQEVEEYYDD